MSFRDNLIHLRAVNNMTQEQLAMLLGVSRQSVTKWESEKSYPEMDKLLKMCQIFGCTLDDLVQGDLTETITEAVVFNQENHQPTDLFGYDEHMTSFAWRIALGVVSPLLGLACAMPLFTLGDPEYTVPPLLPENLSAGFGTTFVFAGVIACLALIIPTGMKHSEFVKAHPFLEDFYTQQQKETTRTCFTRQLVGGICSIFAAICLIIFLGNTSLGTFVGLPLFFLFLALGVYSIVHGGIMFSRTNIATYNQNAGEVLEAHEIESLDLPEDQKRALMKTHKTDERVSAVCGIIMIIATIAGLIMLFVPPYQTPYFWLAWAIGGLLCAVAALLIKAFRKS